MIKSYKIEGDMIRITTQDDGDFVYFKDKFGSIEEIEREIEKKIIIDTMKKNKKDDKLNKLISDLDKKVK